MSLIKNKKFLLVSFENEFSELGEKKGLFQQYIDTNGDGAIDANEKATQDAARANSSQNGLDQPPAAPKKPAGLEKYGTWEAWSKNAMGISDASLKSAEIEMNTYNAQLSAYNAQLNAYNVKSQNTTNENVAETNKQAAIIANTSGYVDENGNTLKTNVDVGFDKNTKDQTVGLANATATTTTGLAQAGSQKYSALVQGEYSLIQSYRQSEQKVFDEINANSSDITKDKSVSLLQLRMIEGLRSTRLTPTTTVEYTDPTDNTKKQSKPIETYSAIHVGSQAFDRANPDAGKLSEFKYYYISSEAAGIKSANGDMLNVDLNSPLVSSVTRVTDPKTHQATYVDDKTHKVLSEEESKKVFASVALDGNPKLANGQALSNYFVAADEADDLYKNKSLANKSQSMYSFLGKMFPNEQFRREAAELISGFGQMNMLEMVIRIVALVKGGKDFHVGGKHGHQNSVSAPEVDSRNYGDVLNSFTEEQKTQVNTLLGAAAYQNGMTKERFTDNLNKVTTDLKAQNVLEKDIEKIKSEAITTYRNYDKQVHENEAKSEALTSNFFGKLKEWVKNTIKDPDSTITNKKGKHITVTSDLLSNVEDNQLETLVKNLQDFGITNIGDVSGISGKIDLSKFKVEDIKNIKATQEKDGSYDVQFIGANKTKLGEFHLSK